jgi:hypothetical protein
MTARKLLYRHLSVRVPWHDTGWRDRYALIHSRTVPACGSAGSPKVATILAR